MNVSGTGSMEQMQMRKMDGTGGGHGGGKGGMKDIMQSLSTEDQTAMKDQLSSMSEEERMAAISQMKSVEKASMNSEEYTQALLDILDQSNNEDSETDYFSVYA